MYLTILGSCRQHSLNNIYNCTGIQEKLTYPHYTKEILQTIKYLKYKNLDDSEVLFTFRTPILEKKISDYNELKKDFDKTDIFVLEIASKMYYKYNDIYLHHIATEEQYNISIKKLFAFLISFLVPYYIINSFIIKKYAQKIYMIITS